MGYLFEHSWEHERERLAAIEGGLDAYSVGCLSAIGVGAGWHCLEIGAGGGSIARWLCDRVGPTGRVVATDLETEFLEEIEAPNLEVRRHDILVDPLEDGAFHLVHARKVLEHLPQPDRVLAKMISAVRPGGWVLVEDADLLSLMHTSAPEPAFFKRAYGAFLDCMAASGYHADLGLHLSDHLRQHELKSVQVRGWTSEWTASGDQPSVYLRTFEKIRERVICERRLSAEEVEHFLSEIRSPSFRAITAVHFAAWGQKS